MEGDHREEQGEQGGRRELVTGRRRPHRRVESWMSRQPHRRVAGHRSFPGRAHPPPENAGSKADLVKYRAEYRAPLQAQIA
jgi:hypothetical protein